MMVYTLHNSYGVCGETTDEQYADWWAYANDGYYTAKWVD